MREQTQAHGGEYEFAYTVNGSVKSTMWLGISLVVWFLALVTSAIIFGISQQRFFRLYERRTGLPMPTDGRAMLACFDRRYSGVFGNGIRALFTVHPDHDVERLCRYTNRKFGICLGIGFAPFLLLFVLLLSKMLAGQSG